MKSLSLLGLVALSAVVACGSASTKSSDPTPVPSSPSDPTPVAAPDTTTPPTSDPSTTTPVVSSPDPVVVVDSGTPVVDSGSDSSVVVDAGPKLPTNQATCIAVCETAHPVAAANNKSLDACMLGVSCGAVCNGLGVGAADKTPSADAGAVCDTSAGWPIATASATCSDCLATTCCKQWVAVFGVADGQDLATCANTCYTTFKN